jgi:truncated hemoglobin YjbI
MNAETPIAEDEISSLVERFYAKVRVDPEIAMNMKRVLASRR